MKENALLSICEKSGVTHYFQTVSDAYRWCVDNGYDIKYLDIRNYLLHGDEAYKVNRTGYRRVLKSGLKFTSFDSFLRNPKPTDFSTPYSSPYDFASNNFSYKITQFA